MVVLKIKAKPASFKDEILLSDEGWMIKIKAKPIDGEANKYLINYLSKEFKIAKSKINIIKGISNPHKTLQLEICEEDFDKFAERFKKSNG